MLFLSSCSLPLQPEAVETDGVSNLVETIQIMNERTPYPTATAYPTQTPYPTYSAEQLAAVYPIRTSESTLTAVVLTEYPRQNAILVNPGLWSRDLTAYRFCGEEFAVKIGYKEPYFGFAIGNEVSNEQFLFVNLMVWNMSDHTIPLIFHKQFSVTSQYNNKLESAQSYGPAGIAASDRWGVHFLSSQGIPPGEELETWLAFDVNYRAEDWKLIFTADDSADFNCRLTLDIPQPSFPINFYQTVEAGG